MLSLTHYLSGVAIASLFPTTLAKAAAGNPFYLLLGGICGLLPDFWDFHVSRYIYQVLHPQTAPRKYSFFHSRRRQPNFPPPWHRQASHSFFAVAIVFGITLSLWNNTTAAIAAGAYFSHIALDYLNPLGANLLFPLSFKRTKGFGFFNADNLTANTAISTAALFCLAASSLHFREDDYRFLALVLFYGLALPALLLWLGKSIFRN